MNRRHSLISAATLALSIVPLRRASSAGALIQSETSTILVGSWKLVSIATVRPNGEELTDWAGPKPTGILMYAADGYMSDHIVKDPPARWAYQEPEEADVTERAHAFDQYYGYFGRYAVDFERSVVTHFVEGSLQPNEVGITYERRFRIEGDRLILTSEVFAFKGEQRFNRLVWQRVKAV